MRIKKVKLATNDIASLTKFYSDKLKFLPLIKERNSVAIEIGRSLLCIEQIAEKIIGNYHLAFEVYRGQLDILHKRLKQSIEFMRQEGTIIFDIKNWKSQSIYFYDSDNNILEFIERDFAPESDGKSSVISIVEFGLALKNMSDLERLREATELDIFPGIVSKEFMPIGDLEGMFICVPNGRIWNPSKHRAGFTQAEVEFIVGEQKKHLIYSKTGDFNVRKKSN